MKSSLIVVVLTLTGIFAAPQDIHLQSEAVLNEAMDIQTPGAQDVETTPLQTESTDDNTEVSGTPVEMNERQSQDTESPATAGPQEADLQEVQTQASDIVTAYDAEAYVPQTTAAYEPTVAIEKTEDVFESAAEDENPCTSPCSSLKAPIIQFVEDKILDLTSGGPLHHDMAILEAGKDISKALTAKIVGPVLIFNAKVAKAAAALPPLLAAKGAIIGAAIATPIEIGAVVSSKVVTGVTGKLVAVPITLAAGAVAKLADAAQQGEEVVQFNLEHGGEILKDGLIRIGHMILKPVAVVVGAQTALTGAGLGIAGSGIKGVGVGIEVVGGKMLATGLAAKGLGHKLIRAQFPPYFK